MGTRCRTIFCARPGRCLRRANSVRRVGVDADCIDAIRPPHRASDSLPAQIVLDWPTPMDFGSILTVPPAVPVAAEVTAPRRVVEGAALRGEGGGGIDRRALDTTIFASQLRRSRTSSVASLSVRATRCRCRSRLLTRWSRRAWPDRLLHPNGAAARAERWPSRYPPCRWRRPRRPSRRCESQDQDPSSAARRQEERA
jgi:hypothetical protein